MTKLDGISSVVKGVHTMSIQEINPNISDTQSSCHIGFLVKKKVNCWSVFYCISCCMQLLFSITLWLTSSAAQNQNWSNVGAPLWVLVLEGIKDREMGISKVRAAEQAQLLCPEKVKDKVKQRKNETPKPNKCWVSLLYREDSVSTGINYYKHMLQVSSIFLLLSI